MQDFKNCAPFNKCIKKIDGTTLLEYSSNYSDTTGSLWFYSKDQADSFNADIGNSDNFKSFKYNAKFFGNTEADGGNRLFRNVTVATPL